MSKKTPKSINFEATLAELNNIIEKMEEGDLSLEESLQAFEKGINLTRECQSALKTAEQKIQMLTTKDGAEVLESIDELDIET